MLTTDLRIRANKEVELSLNLICLSYSMYYCMSLGLSSGSFILMIPVFIHSNYYIQSYLAIARRLYLLIPDSH